MIKFKLQNWLERVDPYYTQRIILRKGLYLAVWLTAINWLAKPDVFAAYAATPMLLAGIYDSPSFVSFRENDGSFRFRLLDAAGEQLLLSICFADGKSAGQVSKRLQSGEALDLREQGEGFALWLDAECIAESPAFADAAACQAAIQRLREALAPAE